jgi:uncharacterized membrane protein YfcA
MLLILFVAAVWAGTQNALAGGGSFITLPALMLSGMDARLANITSTIALFPGQLTTGWFGRKLVAGTGGLSVRALVIISLIGGALGGLLLLCTPSSFFARMVPWLVLFATSVFAWGSFFRKPGPAALPLNRWQTGLAQFAIAIYGGYFGGGIGFLMLAALTMAGLSTRIAGATKNVLAGVMNASAVALFLFTPGIQWPKVAVVCVGAVIGGYGGAWLLKRVDEKLMRGFVVVIGVCLTIGLFLQAR